MLAIVKAIIMVLVLITGCAEQNNGAEAIAPNAASKMIDNLESYVTPDNIGKYDFTDNSLHNCICISDNSCSCVGYGDYEY